MTCDYICCEVNENIVGYIVAFDVVDPLTLKIIVSALTIINIKDALKIINLGIEKIYLYPPKRDIMTETKYLKIISDLFRLTGYASGMLTGLKYQLQDGPLLQKIVDSVSYLEQQQNLILIQLDEEENDR